MRRVSSGLPRKTSSSFSTFLCKAAARSKSSCSLAFSRSSSMVERSDPPLVSRNCTSLRTSTSYSSLVQPAKHGARHIEQIENSFGKCLRGPPRREWAVIRAAGGHAGFIDENAAGHVAAWIGIAQIHLEDRCGAQAHQVAIALGE